MGRCGRFYFSISILHSRLKNVWEVQRKVRSPFPGVVSGHVERNRCALEHLGRFAVGHSGSVSLAGGQRYVRQDIGNLLGGMAQKGVAHGLVLHPDGAWEPGLHAGPGV